MTTPPARRTALITGASAGIGAAFAEVYASRGFDVILTARRLDRLRAQAEGLRAAHGVQVHAVAADLADRESPGRLMEQLSRDGLMVDALVNNAGYALTGTYRHTTWDAQADFLQVMVVAYAELAHRVLPAMVDRRWGRIINVASLAGLVPGTAGHTLYAASKAFLIRFSESLAQEVERYGVHVTALCPGYTRSEFHEVAGLSDRVGRLPRFMWMDAPAVARGGYTASEAGHMVYVNGRLNKTIALLSRWMPQSLVHAVTRRTAGRLRKTA